jgi:hypothetical protein
MGKTGKVVLGFTAAVVLLVIIGSTGRNPGGSSQNTQPADVRLTMNVVCGVTREDGVNVLRAGANGDTAALYGLMDRGKAIGMKKGALVHHTGMVIDGVTLIRALDGPMMGERCYAPATLIIGR